MQNFFRPIVRFLLWLIARIEIVGQENMPASGPYILVTNHVSAWDTPVLLLVCRHKIWALAGERHQRNLFFALVLGLGGSIWVQRGEVDREALRKAMAVLQRGEVLGMAPEGTRARGVYALQPGKTGAAYLATRTDVSIVPVGVTGTELIKEEIKRLRRARVRVVVGEPFRLPESGRVRGARLDEYTEIIMRRIAALLPKEYRGVYGDRPQNNTE